MRDPLCKVAFKPDVIQGSKVKAMAEEQFFSLKEAAEYLGYSVAWLNDPAKKKALKDGGAELGGRGQQSRIPQSLLDSLGWKNENPRKKRAVVTGNLDHEGLNSLRTELSGWESDLADAKERVTELTQGIKEKKQQITRYERELVKQQQKAERDAEKRANSGKAKKLADLRKAKEKAEKDAKRLADRLAKLEAEADD